MRHIGPILGVCRYVGIALEGETRFFFTALEKFIHCPGWVQLEFSGVLVPCRGEFSCISERKVCMAVCADSC